MSSNITNRTISSLIWKFAERCGAQGISFIVSIVLARLLAPEAYGTVALMMVFITILNVFVDSGLGNAIVQKKDADSLDYATVFTFNLGMCSVLYALLFFAAPYIALFYDDPSITAPLRVLGLTLIIGGFRGIQQSYVSKNLLFKRFFYSTIIATAISAIVGIVMAYHGFGVWALVAQSVVNSFVGTMILFVTVNWKPQLRFSYERFRGLFSFGWKLLVSSLIATAYNDVRQLIIGKIYSSGDLAYYNRGKQFPHLIITNINTSIDSVLLPTMAIEQDDKARVKAMTRRAIRTSTYIMAPLMLGLAVCAEPLVRILLTDKWLDSVFFLRVFCVNYLFYPIHTSNLNAIKAMGRSDLFLKMEIFKKCVGISLILATMFISVEAMALSLLVGTLLSTIINAFPNKKLLNYSWFEQMKDILPNIVLSLVMAVPVFLIQYLPLASGAILVLQIIAGGIIYIGLSMLLKLEVFTYIKNIITNFVNNRKAI